MELGSSRGTISALLAPRSALYLAPNESDRSGALRIVRSAAYAVGAAAVLVLMALLIKVLWQ
jgi:hypothetical protein